MARQRPTRLVMGPCIVENDRIVIREVQYQEEVNRCTHEEIIVKVNFGKAWPMWAGRPRIYRIVIREVQYQFEVNRCRNEEIIVKGKFGWAWPMCAGRPRINSIVIREVQYQFEVNRCRNENNIAGRPRIDRIVKREVQYQFEAILSGRGPMWTGAPGLVMGPCIVEIDRILLKEVQYQFEDNRCKNEEFIFQGSMARTDDGQTAEITTISPRFSKCVGIIRDSPFVMALK
ncbi:hypothetical protein DPMN_141916 [Dreissena polymorpha]|uniref:Uncharacterized protein n=1 Tax=Dreissena polymorpha TaxID=45954 RepID=A0A9D4JN05_DREPO|nr:hypothetical protein DPMN_141916 [Dreissena polymorpha]